MQQQYKKTNVGFKYNRKYCGASAKEKLLIVIHVKASTSVLYKMEYSERNSKMCWESKTRPVT